MSPNYTVDTEIKQASDTKNSQIVFRKKLESCKEKARKELDDWHLRQRGWRKEWFHLAVNKLRDCPNIDNIVAKHETTVSGLKEYLQAIAKISNSSGKDAIYLKRKTLALQLKCSVRTISRYRAAAVELGLHTSLGVQVVYTSTGNDNGLAFKGGPSCVYLSKPWWCQVIDFVGSAYDHAQQRLEERRLQSAKAYERVESQIVTETVSSKIQNVGTHKENLAKIRRSLQDPG